jgi:transposase InsO family protein
VKEKETETERQDTINKVTIQNKEPITETDNKEEILLTLDSACSRSSTGSLSLLNQIKPHKSTVRLADDRPVAVESKGTIQFDHNDKEFHIDALHVPGLTDTLISHADLDDAGLFVIHGGKQVRIFKGDPTEPGSAELVAEGVRGEDRLYHITGWINKEIKEQDCDNTEQDHSYSSDDTVQTVTETVTETTVQNADGCVGVSVQRAGDKAKSTRGDKLHQELVSTKVPLSVLLPAVSTEASKEELLKHAAINIVVSLDLPSPKDRTSAEPPANSGLASSLISDVSDHELVNFKAAAVAELVPPAAVPVKPPDPDPGAYDSVLSPVSLRDVSATPEPVDFASARAGGEEEVPDADTLHAQYAHSSLFPPSHPGACDTCARAFAKRVHYQRRNTITTSRPLEIVHTDLCELNRSASGFRYLLTFVDDYTRHATVYFLKNKTKEAVFEKYLDYELHATNLHAPYRISFLQSDNGGEFVNGLMEDYLRSKGTLPRRTQAYTPQQNGVAERFNQTLVGKARALLIHSCVPNYLWQHAINTSVYLYNRTPHRTIGMQKPIARWHVESLNPLPLAVFGCRGYVTYTSDKPRSKFEERGPPAIFLEYLEDKKGYLMLDEATNKLIESRDVRFNQSLFPFREKRPKPDLTVRGR